MEDPFWFWGGVEPWKPPPRHVSAKRWVVILLGSHCGVYLVTKYWSGNLRDPKEGLWGTKGHTKNIWSGPLVATNSTPHRNFQQSIISSTHYQPPSCVHAPATCSQLQNRMFQNNVRAAYQIPFNMSTNERPALLCTASTKNQIHYFVPQECLKMRHMSFFCASIWVT